MRRRDGDNILDEDEVSLSDVRILYADASRSIELPLHVPVPVPLLPVVAVPATMVSMGVGPVGMDLEFDDEDLVATASLRDISRLRSEEGRWPRTHSRSRSARTESPRSSPSNGATPKSRSPRREGSGASRNGSSLRPSESVSKTASKESMSTLNTLRAGRERAERRRRGSRLSQEVVEEEGGEDFVGRTPRGSPGPGE